MNLHLFAWKDESPTLAISRAVSTGFTLLGADGKHLSEAEAAALDPDNVEVVRMRKRPVGLAAGTFPSPTHDPMEPEELGFPSEADAQASQEAQDAPKDQPSHQEPPGFSRRRKAELERATEAIWQAGQGYERNPERVEQRLRSKTRDLLTLLTPTEEPRPRAFSTRLALAAPVEWQALCHVGQLLTNGWPGLADRPPTPGLVYMATNSVGGRKVEGGGDPDDFVLGMDDGGWEGWREPGVKLLEWTSASSGAVLRATREDPWTPGGWTLEYIGPLSEGESTYLLYWALATGTGAEAIAEVAGPHAEGVRQRLIGMEDSPFLAGGFESGHYCW
jgi:hypothetical protein